MNIVTRFGNWIEKHWPEKMTASDVSNMFGVRFTAIESALKECATTFGKIEERVLKLESELSTFKTQSIVKSRIAGDAPTRMTAFASRAPNGGNQSPQ